MNYHTEQQFKALSNKVKDYPMRMRLLAAAYFKVGIHRSDVARTLDVNHIMINECVANIFKEVISALKSKYHWEEPIYYIPSKKRADWLH
ncbi:MAG: hypothetical protein QMC38_10300 [Sinobacterium sp.]